ncbi:MAG TPA: Gfo/Idh/MocA family oxidoreductase, partial [Clostridia bacterium]
MKVALIGAGSISSRHITMMKEIGEYQVIAIADPVFSLAKELAEPCGAKAYESIDNLLEDCQPELVDICSPAYLHYEHTLKCLSAGLNVFCEKPMTHTTEEADELIALAKEKGVFYMVGHVLRFWPEYEFLKKMIYKQPYGRLRYALFNRQYGTHRPGSWYMDPEKCK